MRKHFRKVVENRLRAHGIDHIPYAQQLSYTKTLRQKDFEFLIGIDAVHFLTQQNQLLEKSGEFFKIFYRTANNSYMV